jgi:hypothetical protein
MYFNKHYLDLDNVIGQRPSNKSGFGYKKFSKTSNCPKSKEKQSQESNAKIVKSTNAKSFNKKHNYAFQYKQFDKKINKGKINFQRNNAIFFNPSWSNKLYFKGPDGWFYEFKNQNNFQIKTQRYEHKRVVSQKHKNISKEKPKTQAQGLKYIC